MANVTARINVKGDHFEIQVDLDEALKIRSEEAGADITKALGVPKIFSDLKKGEVPTTSDLESAFGTTDAYKIAEKIIKSGEVQKTQEYRDEEREKKIKQVVSLIVKNAVDQHGNPYTEGRIERAIGEIHYSFDKRPAEQQMSDIVHKLKEVIPIKIETKRIKLTIPAQFTGQAYSVINEYKENEEWLSNGDLSVIVNIPSGIQIDFYEKLNSITHGAAQSEELTS